MQIGCRVRRFRGLAFRDVSQSLFCATWLELCVGISPGVLQRDGRPANMSGIPTRQRTTVVLSSNVNRTLTPSPTAPPSAAAVVGRRAQPAPLPAQEPADERCDYIPVPPIGYDDEGYPVEDSVTQSQRLSVREYWPWAHRMNLGGCA